MRGGREIVEIKREKSALKKIKLRIEGRVRERERERERGIMDKSGELEREREVNVADRRREGERNHLLKSVNWVNSREESSM